MAFILRTAYATVYPFYLQVCSLRGQAPAHDISTRTEPAIWAWSCRVHTYHSECCSAGSQLSESILALQLLTEIWTTLPNRIRASLPDPPAMSIRANCASYCSLRLRVHVCALQHSCRSSQLSQLRVLRSESRDDYIGLAQSLARNRRLLSGCLTESQRAHNKWRMTRLALCSEANAMYAIPTLCHRAAK